MVHSEPIKGSEFSKFEETTWRAYIDNVAIVSQTNEQAVQIRYTHTDRLGSSRLFTNHNGDVLATRNYDPFGKPRLANGNSKPSARLGDIVDTTTYRGFTDHEHLDEQQLIHMNGRVYDYNLGRFMSVDPVIQSPGNSQSINPYSYIMNNPLAGTDPSGYNSLCLKGESRVGCGGVGGLSKGEINKSHQFSGGLNEAMSELGFSSNPATTFIENSNGAFQAQQKGHVAITDINSERQKGKADGGHSGTSGDSEESNGQRNLKIDRLNDQIDAAEASKAKESEYSITLVAHLDKSTDFIGHAFVIMRGPNGEFAKGFWPKDGASENDFIFDTPLEGALSDEGNYYSRFKSWQATGKDPGKQGGQFAYRSFGLTRKQFQSGVSAISNWNSTPYKGQSRMCGSFATHVLRATGQSYGNSKTPYYLFYDMGGSFDKN